MDNERKAAGKFIDLMLPETRRKRRKATRHF